MPETERQFIDELCCMIGINTGIGYDGVLDDEDARIYREAIREEIPKLLAGTPSIYRLYSPINKLARTADGVPLYPGMIVYEESTGRECAVRAIRDGGESGHLCTVFFAGHPDEHIPTKWIFSTSAALRARRGEEPPDRDE